MLNIKSHRKRPCFTISFNPLYDWVLLLVYIYIERERERQRERQTDRQTELKLFIQLAYGHENRISSCRIVMLKYYTVINYLCSHETKPKKQRCLTV